MSEWVETTIGELCKIKHGWAFKGEYFADKGEFILLTPGNFLESGGLQLRENKEKYYSGEFPSEYLFNKNDLAVVMTDLVQTAPILGGSAWIPSDNKFLHNQRLGNVIEVNEKLVTKNFLYWIFNSESYRKQIRGSASGATVRHTAPERIYKCKVKLPPLPIQQKIAAILSAYDDLIENNLKQIKLLEEMAQITYEEWFVRFKFLGHENTPVDEVTGLPLGWERKKLGDLTSYINRGISPSYVESDGFSVINQKCIRNHFVNFEESRLTSNAKSISEDKQLKKFDILINSTGTGTLGRIAQLFESINHATVDTHVTIIRAGDVSSLLLGRALEHAEGFIESLGKGATNQQELSRTDLAEIVELVVPSQDLQNKYDELAMPIYDTITFYRKQNQLLKEARDILLPRLMTGKIAV